MAHVRRQDTFDDTDYESCPVGGEWWKCEDISYPTFIGCCSSNPCSGQMCPADNLYAMGFGAVTSPTPDYPNHSCPYGGLWYTCAANDVPFQGCCESNPCNGQGCPASDLRPAGVHTVVVGGTSTFTVPSSVATPAPTSTSGTAGAASTTSAVSQPVHITTTSKPNTAAIAGGSVAAGVVLLAAIAVALYFCLRRRRAKRAANDPLHNGTQSQEYKGYYQDPGESALTPLPHYAKKAAHLSSSSGDPYSPTPTYTSFGPQQTQQETTNPQEIMGLGLSAAEFNRRSKSRIPFQHSDGPVELGSERPSGNRPDLGARSPLLESDSANTNDERTSISAQWPGSQGAQGARFQESI